MSFVHAHHQWEDGTRRLRESPPELRPTLERVIDRIVDELHRRLGGPFSTDELAALYDEGTDWCLSVAMDTAPEDPRAWDAYTLAGAAFARYAREAADFAGGRRLSA